MSNWHNDQVADIIQKISKDPVFAAVGDDLKEAMIAREVMRVLVQLDDLDVPVPTVKFSRLFQVICYKMLPNVWTE